MRLESSRRLEMIEKFDKLDAKEDSILNER